MRQLPPFWQRVLKVAHLLLASLWIGGALSMVLLQGGFKEAHGEHLAGIDVAMKIIDDFIIIPGAMGCLATGLIYSIWTRWGFVQHGWVAVKWVITVGGILFGTFWLGPWLNAMVPVSAELGADALADPAYDAFRSMNGTGAKIQTSTLLLAFILSTFKPWSSWPVAEWCTRRRSSPNTQDRPPVAPQ
jgi:hypothetical protein